MKKIQDLIDGYGRFRESYYEANRERFTALGRAQNPKVMMIGCCDARLEFAHLMGAEAGDLFVVRNIANLVPPFEPEGRFHGTSAALEFAVGALGIQHVIVLGHSGCGGIAALRAGQLLAEDGQSVSFIARWMSIAKPVRDRILAEMPHHSPADQQRALEQAALINSVRNLVTFPFVRDRVVRGELFLHGWYFDIAPGLLYAHDADRDEFVPVESVAHTHAAADDHLPDHHVACGHDHGSGIDDTRR